MAMDIHTYIVQLFATKQGLFKNLHDALTVFEEEWPLGQYHITLAGELIRSIQGLTVNHCKKVLWVNVELSVPQSRPALSEEDKATRMRPLAIFCDNVDAVRALHEQFFTDPQAWETTTKSQGWIPLSKVMDLWKDRPALANFFVAFPRWEDASRFMESEWYKDGSMVILSPRQQGENYFLLHKDLEEPVDTWAGVEGFTFKRLIDWLNTFTDKAGQRVGCYLGYEHPARPGIRLYAAFTADVGLEALRQVTYFAEFLQNSYTSLILQALRPGNLPAFWSATSDLEHDDFHEGKAFPHLRALIGWHDTSSWPLNIDQECIRESLKTMCGRGSSFEGGEERLTLVGAFLLLLAALSIEKMPVVPDDVNFGSIDIDKDLARHAYVLPLQRKEEARAAAEALLTMLRLLVANDTDASLNLQKVALSRSAMELYVKIDSLHASKEGRLPLADAVPNAVRSQVSTCDKPPGNMASAIVDYWLKSNIRRESAVNFEGTFFPCSGGIELLSENGATRLRLRPCI